MRLIVVDGDGNCYEVTDELEAYDLSKPLAVANLIDEIRKKLDEAMAERE